MDIDVVVISRDPHYCASSSPSRLGNFCAREAAPAVFFSMKLSIFSDTHFPKVSFCVIKGPGFPSMARLPRSPLSLDVSDKVLNASCWSILSFCS